MQMQMPDEIGKYIQDFIRPTQPNSFNDTYDYAELEDYYEDLKRKITLIINKFVITPGMVFIDNTNEYLIKEVSRNKITIETSGITKIVKRNDRKLNLVNLENKPESIKRFYKINRMLKLIQTYLCLPKNTDLTVFEFYKKMIRRKHKRFWTNIYM